MTSDEPVKGEGPPERPRAVSRGDARVPAAPRNVDAGVRTSGYPGPLRWLARQERLRQTTRWFLLSGVVGLVAGLGAVFFFEISDWLFERLMGDVAGYRPVAPRGESGDVTSVFDYVSAKIDPLWCVLLPALGGLAVGLLVYTFAPEAQGHGTDGAVDAYHRGGGIIRARVIWVKTLASAITLGTGGSGGREGPIAQIGAGFGSWIATRLRLSNRERRILLAAGMGAGVAAIFRAPLAGALFAAEILYREPDQESEVVLPSLISSIIAYSTFTFWHGHGTLFATNEIANSAAMVFTSPAELIPYTVLAIVLSGLVFFYVKALYGTEHLFGRLKVLPHVKPMIGGALTGALALLLVNLIADGRVLNVLAFGYASLQEAFDVDGGAVQAASGVPWDLVGMFALVAVGKVVATSLTIGSGGSAGVFGPSMVIGGAAGAAVGVFFHHAWPDVAPHPAAFTLVGMAGFFTGAAHVPISTLLMVSEITGNYQLLVPAMWVTTCTFAFCRRISIYQNQVPSRMDSPAHRGDFVIDILEGLYVRDLADRVRAATTVRADTPLRKILEVVRESKTPYFPVVSGEDRLIGIFSINDIRRYLHDESMWDLLVGADIMVGPVLAVTEGDTLNTVMRRFTEKNIDEVPVVDVDDSGVLLGMLRRREVIAAYNARIVAHKSDT